MKATVASTLAPAKAAQVVTASPELAAVVAVVVSRLPGLDYSLLTTC
jgi:hypothetical protein